jgi:hypothetical protein
MAFLRLLGWRTSQRTTRPSVRRARLGVETLESRLVPSTTTGSYDPTWPVTSTTSTNTVYTTPISPVVAVPPIVGTSP